MNTLKVKHVLDEDNRKYYRGINDRLYFIDTLENNLIYLCTDQGEPICIVDIALEVVNSPTFEGIRS